MTTGNENSSIIVTDGGNLMYLNLRISKDKKLHIWGVQKDWLYKTGGRGWSKTERILESEAIFGNRANQPFFFMWHHEAPFKCFRIRFVELLTQLKGSLACKVGKGKKISHRKLQSKM